MTKRMNKKGFTLAELLIVIAIIAVLVAIAIPTFAASLEKANRATDDANIRAAYSQYVIDKMTASAAVEADPDETDIQAAFTKIGVNSLKHYATITPSENSWTGAGGPGGASSITKTT